MADFAIKQNDTLPVLQVTILQGNGQPLDLTGAAVTFKMETLDGTVIVNDASCVIVGSPANGVVQYQWLAANTATPGTYRGEFHVTFSGGAKVTAPTLGYDSIVVEPRL